MALAKNIVRNKRRKAAVQAGWLAVSTAVAGVWAPKFVQADITVSNPFSYFGTPNLNTTAAANATNLGYLSGGTVFETTNGAGNEAVSGFDLTPQTVSSFDVTFVLTATAGADGGAFIIDGNSGGTSYLGAAGGSGGYDGGTNDSNTLALQWEYYNAPSAGVSKNGTSGTVAWSGVADQGQGTPGVPVIDNGDQVQFNLAYFGTTLTENVVDLTSHTGIAQVFSGVHMPVLTGTSTAYVGFSGGTGGSTSTQKISNFVMVSNKTYTPIAISSGFNEKGVIPDGGSLSSITATQDNGTKLGGDTWYETGFDAAAPTTGLPHSGATFTSQADSSHTFTMQSYANNDVVLLSGSSTGDGPSTATITFSSTTQPYNALSFLTASGNGPNVVGLTINYSDGHAATTGLSFLSPDWFSGSPSAWTANGRYSGTYDNVNSGNPNLYSEDVTLPDNTDPISSVTLTFQGGNRNPTGNVFIFAISGEAGAAGPAIVYTGSANKTGSVGTWDNGITQNFNGISGSITTPVTFANGDQVTFDDTAVGPHTVNIASQGMQISSWTVNTSTGYIFTGYGLAGYNGSGGLSINNTGAVVLSNGANTFTGGTNINAGLLQMNGSTSLASTTVSVASGATLNVSTGTSLTASSLTLNDSGTVNYAPSNFSIGSLSGSAPGVLNMTAPAGFALTIGGGTYGGNITGTSGSVAFTGSNTFSGTISDGTTAPISVTVNASSGTVVFSGSNTYTGGTYLVSGATEITSASAVGPSTIYLQGGALGAYGGSVNLPNLLTGGALIVPSNSGLLEISNSANTFTGPVVIQSGATLQVDSPGAIGGMNGANATTGTIIVASGATFIANDNSGTLGLTGGVPGGAPISLVLSGSGVGAIGALTTPSGTPTGSNGTWAGGINISGPAQVSPGLNATLTLSGAITGNGPVSFAPTSNSSSSSNTIILSPPTASSNTYTGESQVYGGTGTLVAFTVQLGNSNGFSPDAGLNFNGGTGGVTVDLYGNNQTVTYLTGSGPAGSALTNSNGNPSTLTISSGLNNGAPSTFSTPIGGNVAVVMNDPTGQGNQILSGASNYSGGTTITKGTLSVAAPSALGTGTVFLNGGTLAFPSASPGSLSNYVLNGVATYGNNTLTLTNNGQDEASSAFTRSPVAINLTTGFTVSYLMNLNAVNTGYVADGIGFVLQNDSRGANAVGNGGSGIGWTGIQNSFVAGFETYGYDFGQGGANDVEFGTSGGGAGTFNQVTTSGLALTSEPAEVVLTYNGSQFTETITEEGGAGASYTTTYAVNLASVLGSSTAYLGFTGGTGDGTATQTVTNFSLSGVAAGAISIANPIVANPGTTSVIQVATGSGNTTETFTSLNLGSGSVVTITTPNGSTGKLVVSTPSLTIAQNSSGAFTAKLDVGINSLDLPANSTNTLAGITAMVAQGYAGGKWNGEGIASSAAAADTTFLTALGVIANDNGSGTPLYGPGGTIASTFEGATPADGDILVKLTYYGDADLSGTVDGSDYSRIDNGILLGLTGWQNGDFNYDGVIDGSDYTLIDNSYNTQGAQFTTEVAATTAEIAAVTGSSVSGSAVPEPTTLGLIGIGAAAMLGRRRRRMI